MNVKTIGVIGAGASGREIACASVLAGFRTVLEDVSPESLDQAVAYVYKSLEAGVCCTKLTPNQKTAANANLYTARNVEDACRQADLLIEALPEELELKLEIFTIFDKFARPGAILASNTSSFSIKDLAEMTFRRDNCVGLRLRHSAPNENLLEVIRAPETSDATVAACADVGRRMGKEVVVLDDAPEIIPGRISAIQE